MPIHADIPIEALHDAARRPEAIETMRAFYEEVDRRISAEQPTCWNRGVCCRFGEYGHRLYVTALEAVYYLAMQADPRSTSLHAANSEAPAAGVSTSLPILIPPVTSDVCPYAYDGQCHARDHRPLGCRIFYCDPNAQSWQGPLTEEYLEELKRLHRELGVPYFYTDWMGVLRALQDQGAAR